MSDITISDIIFADYSADAYIINSSYNKFTNNGYYFGGKGAGGPGGHGITNNSSIH